MNLALLIKAKPSNSADNDGAVFYFKTIFFSIYFNSFVGC